MTAQIALIDYGSGNLRSADKALLRATRERATGQEIVVTSDPDQIARAERIVLPGVGAFGDCVKGLSAINGMIEALNDTVLKRGIPFLGICVGMQLLASVGREFGEHAGLGWIEGEVVKLTPSDPALKIPQIGWNELNITQPHPLFAGVAVGSHAYFVHSYAMKTKSVDHVLATSDFGGAFAAAVGRDNIAGTQFHPEKSQAVGLTLLGNFLEWRP